MLKDNHLLHAFVFSLENTFSLYCFQQVSGVTHLLQMPCNNDAVTQCTQQYDFNYFEVIYLTQSRNRMYNRRLSMQVITIML